jgi:Ca2+-dependent lipid-binding protein
MSPQYPSPIDRSQPLHTGTIPPSYPYLYISSVKAKGVKLDSKDANGSSDPFFEIKAQPTGYLRPITLYRSEPVMKNKNPSWNPFEINLRDVHGLDTQFTINVYDWDQDGGKEVYW